LRAIIGCGLLFSSAMLAIWVLGRGCIEEVLPIVTVAWALGVAFTDKYIHKYPQRYLSYVLASHLKAGIIMALFLLLAIWIFGSTGAPASVVWACFAVFVLADILTAVPSLRADARTSSAVDALLKPEGNAKVDQPTNTKAQPVFINAEAVIKTLRAHLGKELVDFVEGNLSESKDGLDEVVFLDDPTPVIKKSARCEVALLFGRTKINDIRRLNQFLSYSVHQVAMGGYLVLQYLPLESVRADLRRRYAGVLYWPAAIVHFVRYRILPKIPWLDTLYFSPLFSWVDRLCLTVSKKRNRVLSKAEVWGRLSYFGMRVVAESTNEGERYVIARRESCPVQGKMPSYYPVVSLEKMALDGEIIRVHKIRTMFPFSEFLQKRIFEEHGLATSGKFQNEFRLTELGKLLRKVWLDELPQIFDWLRGDIKLVGMRATSRQFLTLYPEHFLELYFQVKPGLVPPIFDEATNGFDEIVDVELRYLRSYVDQPFLTDVRYFIQTFRDIVFRGIRSH
jgi:lipopolysaccharide/colanic/teichoic acid biosynthesis glycosyltransferase